MKNKIYKYLVFAIITILPLSLLANTVPEATPANLPGHIITGRVSDSSDVPLVGVTIREKGTNNGTVTDMSGHFKITVANDHAVLSFSYIGYDTKEVSVNGRSTLNVRMERAASMENEVVVTAFGIKQNKESVVGAISTVRPSDLRVPSSNLTTAFAGRLPGVIAFQRSGEPGLNNAQFFIRGVTSFSAAGKKDPLILVDGIEMTATDLARLNVDDIASFSILKDASATALYGARAANGVILITTKQGKVERLKVSVRAEMSRTSNSDLVKLADPITYMTLQNEGTRARNDMVILPYSLSKIRNTRLGTDPINYPSVDWYHYLIAKSAPTQRLNLDLTGGGQTVQYFLSANYQHDAGIIKESKANKFNNNIDINRLQVRSNVTIKFTPTTTGIVRAYGSFINNKGPRNGGAAVFGQARNASPVQFLPFYPPDSANEFTNHILFGSGPELGVYDNPLADLLSTFSETRSSMMLWQFELKHDFNTGFLRGLSVRGLYNTMRSASNTFYRGYSPFYYVAATTADGSYQLQPLNPDKGTEYLSYGYGPKTENSSMYGELRLSYDRTFNKVHDVNVTLVGTMRNETSAAPLTLGLDDMLKATLPLRNISTSGRFAYGYKSRYFFEFDFGYNGSERFSKAHRWGLFPAIGAGWMVSKEPFMAGVKKVVNKLKLRATYGKVGNDQIGSLYDRFFYLSQVNMNGPGYWFGLNRGFQSGVSIERYANPDITWEIAKKADLGINLGLFNDLITLDADAYWQTRSNILQTRADVPTTMGLQTIPTTNVGEAGTHGFEGTLKVMKDFNNGTWLIATGNFTYSTGKYKKYEEPDYSDVPWRSHVGLKLNQPMGYIAERLFIDQKEVANSPDQQFGEYEAGDIKYKDINGDGVINAEDVVPIGFPVVPEIIYGAGLTFGVKAFDFSIFFQGSARSSFFISPADITPFVNQGQRGLLQVIADNHWSLNNRNLTAFWPRLSTEPIANNDQASTWWLRNGAFVRLKSAEIGYTLPAALTRKISISKVRFYVNGLNLYVWSKFKLWDPEMGGNGLGYPIQRVINLGVKIDF